MSAHRLRTAAVRSGAAVMAATALTLLSAGLASAHVTIGPGTTAKGATDFELTFRVPNEEAAADTTRLEVAFPTDHPITGVLPESTPGWKATVTNHTLPKPVTTDDGTVTQVVSTIAWTGGAVMPGQYQGFRVLLGKVPDDVSQLTFKAVQTYSNGDVVRWIDLAQPGQPAPDHPAPVLTLTAPSTPAGVNGTTVTATTGTGTTNTATSSDSTARTLGTVGIVVGAAGLAAGAYGLAKARRKGSGPTGS